MFFISSTGFGQTVFEFNINPVCLPPPSSLNVKINITGIRVGQVYWDNGTDGGTSFQYFVQFSIINDFSGTVPGNLYDYTSSVYSTVPRAASIVELRPIPLPPVGDYSNTGYLSPGATFQGSASSRGLQANTTYNQQSIIDIFGYNSATLYLDFSPCYKGVTNGVLPVTLSSFTLNSTESKAVELNWTTADETDNSGFDVEHSLDAKSWSKLGFVQTKAAEGNSTTDIQYSFLHSSPHLGQNYYRLIQYDFDGKSTPSVIRSINVFSAESVVIYPNPVVDVVRINVKDEIGKVSEMGLTDATGKDIKKLSAQATEVNLSGLSSGVYYLYLLTEKGTVYKKLFKN